MSGMKIFQLNHAEKIQEHAQWECGEHDEFSQEHIEKCLKCCQHMLTMIETM